MLTTTLIFIFFQCVFLIASMLYVATESPWSPVFLILLTLSGATLSYMHSDALEKAGTYEQKYNQLLTSTQKLIEIPKPTTE